MNITALYEALDELVDEAEQLREAFTDTGELKELEKSLDAHGSRTYAVSRGVMRTAQALNFSDE